MSAARAVGAGGWVRARCVRLGGRSGSNGSASRKARPLGSSDSAAGRSFPVPGSRSCSRSGSRVKESSSDRGERAPGRPRRELLAFEPGGWLRLTGRLGGGGSAWRRQGGRHGGRSQFLVTDQSFAEPSRLGPVRDAAASPDGRAVPRSRSPVPVRGAFLAARRGRPAGIPVVGARSGLAGQGGPGDLRGRGHGRGGWRRLRDDGRNTAARRRRREGKPLRPTEKSTGAAAWIDRLEVDDLALM